MPFYPGPGLGGHCIPIDPFYLTWKAREFDITTRFIELAGQINSHMPHYVVARLAEALDRKTGRGLSNARILIIGVAYKKNVDDMRESPSLRLIEMIEERGPTISRSFHSVIPKRGHTALAGRTSVAIIGGLLRRGAVDRSRRCRLGRSSSAADRRYPQACGKAA
jgi:UDP-N-acetyl-D-glucosamine dehydrogenase